MSPTTGSNALAASTGVSGLSGVASSEHGAAPWCARAAARTAATGAARRPDRATPPRRRERVRERRLLVEQLLRAVAQPARLDDRDERARREQVGRRCSSAVSHGSHDSMPSKVCPSASRSQCSRPHGSVRQQLGRAGTHFLGRQQLAYGEEPRVVELAVRTLVGDRELRQPVDLVTPEVDAHRMVGGRRVDVDDRTAHRELAARLDLVLAAVAHRDELLDELVAVELRAGRHDDRFDVLDVRAEPLHERADRRDDDLRAGGRHPRAAATSPAGAGPSSRSPATPARTAASPTPGTARPRRRRGTAAGRPRAAPPRRRSAPRAHRPPRRRRRERRGEEGARGLGHGHRVTLPGRRARRSSDRPRAMS